MQKAPKLFCLMALGLASTGVLADDYYVSPAGDDGAAGDSGAPFATIAHALTLAQDDDTIHLAEGTYTEHDLTLGVRVSVIGESGSRDTVIVDANKAGRVFSIAADGATIANLTVKNGNLGSGSGANVNMTANGVVSNCVVKDGVASGNGSVGANIYMTGGLVIDTIRILREVQQGKVIRLLVGILLTYLVDGLNVAGFAMPHIQPKVEMSCRHQVPL